MRAKMGKPLPCQICKKLSYFTFVRKTYDGYHFNEEYICINCLKILLLAETEVRKRTRNN